MTKNFPYVIMLVALLSSYARSGDSPDYKDLPDVKEGLWDSVTTMQTQKPMHTTMCTSNVVSRKVYDDTHKNPNRPCKEIHSERHGSVVTSQTECKFNDKVTRSTSTITLTGNTAFHLEMRDGNDKVETVIDSKWVSACPAGMKLGDVTGPDGKIMMNMLAP